MFDGLGIVEFINNNNNNFQSMLLFYIVLYCFYLMIYNYSYRCSDGDVCCVDAQMMNEVNDWSVQVREAYIHLKWWKPTWDFLPHLQSASDWLPYQAEAVHAKTVYLGSCAICVYHIATLRTVLHKISKLSIT